MHYFITCKNEEDQINKYIMYVLITCKFKRYLTNNNNKEKVETPIFQTLKAANSKSVVRSSLNKKSSKL